MSASTTDQTERLVQFSRRQLWFVLIFLFGLGVTYLVDMFFVVHISPMLSVLIAMAVIFINPLNNKDLDCSPSNPAMQVLRNDELRQVAQAKAFRNGFFVLLAYPPLCAIALTGLAVTNPLPVVVESGAWSGAVVFLASLLWHDR